MNIQSFRGYIPQRPVQTRDHENLATNRAMSKDVSFESGKFNFNIYDARKCITNYAVANNLTVNESENLSRRVLNAAEKIKNYVKKIDGPDTYLSIENPIDKESKPIDKELKIKIGCGDFYHDRKYYDRIHFPSIGPNSDRKLTKHLDMLNKDVVRWIGDIVKQSKNEASAEKTATEIGAAVRNVFENFQV